MPVHWCRISASLLCHCLPLLIFYFGLALSLCLPCNSSGKETLQNGREPGSIPGLGRSSGGGHDNPLQSSCLENPRGQRSLAGCSPWGHRASDRTEWLRAARRCPQLLHCLSATAYPSCSFTRANRLQSTSLSSPPLSEFQAEKIWTPCIIAQNLVPPVLPYTCNRVTDTKHLPKL